MLLQTLLSPQVHVQEIVTQLQKPNARRAPHGRLGVKQKRSVLSFRRVLALTNFSFERLMMAPLREEAPKASYGLALATRAPCPVPWCDIYPMRYSGGVAVQWRIPGSNR